MKHSGMTKQSRTIQTVSGVLRSYALAMTVLLHSFVAMCEGLRKLIPVIVFSNLGGDTEIKRALEMGADDYFVKSQHPIEEVIEKVKEYFEGKRTKKPQTHARGFFV